MRSIDRAARARSCSRIPLWTLAAAPRPVGRAGGGLATANSAAAAKMSRRAARSAGARKMTGKNSTDTTAIAIHAYPPNPTSRPPTKTRYVAVMSGSAAPVACRRILVPQCAPRGIIHEAAQSNGDDCYTASGKAARWCVAWPMKVDPVVPVSSTVRYFPISEASPGTITVLKSRVRD